MKAMPLAVGALCMVLGMSIVWYFFGQAPHPKSKHSDPPPVSSSVETEPSRRIVIYPSDKAGGPPKIVSQTPDSTVDVRWANLNGEAIAALDTGQNARAVELFEQCHVGVPTEKVFTSNLAEALARLSTNEYDAGSELDRESAVTHLTRAAELAPDREDLATRLAQMKQLLKSEAGMWTDESEHFQVSYDGERSDLLGGASQITMALETAYQQYGELFDSYPVEKGRAKIRVVLYKNDGFHQATGIGHWAGGLYDGAIRVPVENLQREKQNLVRVLRHELAHAFVHESGGRDVPGWLNEGLAQRLESDSMSMAVTMLENTRHALRGTQLIPLEKMSGSLGELKEDAKIAQGYRQALAFVAWIESTYGERVPYEMVAGHKKKGGIAAAFFQRAGVKLDDAFADFAAGL
jgi:tetratricopeptide (TPR) repeat protein